jgi:hypothetical protein
MNPLTNTNAPIAYTPKRFANEILGVSGVRMRADSPEYKFIVGETRRFNDMRMKAMAAGPSSEPRLVSMTNEGRVIDVLIKPDGEPLVVQPSQQVADPRFVTLTNEADGSTIKGVSQGGRFTQQYNGSPLSGLPSGAGAITQYSPQQQQQPSQATDPSGAAVTGPAAAAPNTSVNQVAAPVVAPPPSAPIQDTVRVMAPNGAAGRIPVGQLEQALKEGYTQIQ